MADADRASTRDANGDRKPTDLTRHYNAVTRARKPSAMKGLYKYFMVPGMSNIAGGALSFISCAPLTLLN
jgi:hypothetical protein